MSQGVFRETTIQFQNEKLKLVKKPINEIFKFGQAPYIICGTTNSGKTTLALDLFQNYSEQCTKMFYITKTEENLIQQGHSGDISVIPRAYRRKPKYEIIYGIWKDIQDELEAHRYDIEKFKVIIRKLFGQEVGTNILKQLDAEKAAVNSEQLIYYKTRYPEGDAVRLASTDANAFYCEVVARLIADKAKQNTDGLTTEELNATMAFVSDYPKVLLILDDVSAELEALNNQKKIVQFNGASMQIASAYRSLLLDILTTGRHKNAIICLFLHDIDIIQKMKSQLENLILLNSAAANKIIMSRTFGQDIKHKIETIIPILFTTEYMYHFLYMSLSKSIICVGKAELFQGTSIKLSTINKNFIEAYNAALGIKQLNDGDSDEESESEEEGGGEIIDDRMFK
jgi:hypothetical protein